MKNINIVLDIDGMLALNEGARIQELLPKDALKLLEDSFIDVDFEHEKTKYSYLHYLLPGCFEFIKAILDIPNAKLIFFSNGVESRNVELVQKIMDKDVSYYIDGMDILKKYNPTLEFISVDG